MKHEMASYAVYLFPAALETLGEAVAPYVVDGPHGKYLLCAEIDAGGMLFEATIHSHDEAGKLFDVELMFPASMVKLVISTQPESELGFT
jgi:hypothetical protein